MPEKFIVLKQNFFSRPAKVVASELLGKFIVRRIGKKRIADMITEVEVYDGFNDRASHAFRGITKRNYPMFGPGGFWYVYFVYGMHWMLNIVTGKKNYPSAILIRGTLRLSGPGKLTKCFKINGSLNNKRALPKNGLWIEDRGVKIKKSQIIRKPRIGVDYAGKDKNKKLNFSIINLENSS